MHRVTCHAIGLLSFLSSLALAGDFQVGFNQGWIRQDYSSYLVSRFDETELRRTFKVARDHQVDLLRFWIFEGHDPGAFVWEGDRPRSVKPEFIKNLRSLIAIAREHGIKLNLTLFDGNISTMKIAFSETQKNWWHNLLNYKFGADRDFKSHILSPVFDLLNEPASRATVTHIDLANEINAMTFSMIGNGVRFSDGWTGANRFICDYYHLFKGDPRVSYLQVSASVGWWQGYKILSDQPWSSCVDYFSFHLYNDSGNIPDCAELALYAKTRGKKIYLGEFGQLSKSVDDALQTRVTNAFLKNAQQCGLDGAWAWAFCLPDREDYLAFERFGQPRPALQAVRDFKAGL